MKNKLFFVSILILIFVFSTEALAQSNTKENLEATTNVQPLEKNILEKHNTSENFATITQFQALEKQVNILDQINNKILNTIYWALGGLITVFLSVVGLNFFQNFSLNKNKFDSFRGEVLAELEVNREKNNAIINSEKEKANSESLKTLSEINCKVEKKLTELKDELDNKIKLAVNEALKSQESKIKKIQDDYEDVQRDNLVRQAFEHKQKNQMGYIYNLVNALEIDIKKGYSWQIEETLERIITCLNEGYKDASSMEKLNSVLSKLPKDYDFTKKKIEEKMTL